MREIAVNILLALSALLGTESHPPVNEDWKIVTDWEKTEEGYLLFVAESDEIACKCQENPTAYIEFPTAIHSSSQALLGNQVIAATSSPDFQYTRGFYGGLVVPCYQINNCNHPLTWRVLSYTEYFAWVKFFPRIGNRLPVGNFFKETLHIGAALILLILCLLYLILFTGKIPRRELLTLILSNFFTAIYFMGTVAGLLGIKIPMLTAHRIADAGLWVGFLFFIQTLYIEKLIPRWMDITYKVSILIGLSIILTANTGDVIQLGTTVPFGFTMVFIFYAVWKMTRKNFLKRRKHLLQLIGLSCFLIAYSNDLFVVTGITNSIPVLPIGVAGSYVFILLSINERITKTYTERDELKSLTIQSNIDLGKSQDELIKSEKMAALGRAVARIAHELNTPICAARSAAQNIDAQTKKMLQKLDVKDAATLKAEVSQYDTDFNTMGGVLMSSLSRAAKLVRDFKEVSNDQINVQKRAFELHSYIETSLTTMKAVLKTNKINIRVQGDKVALHSDPGLFYQIIENLITNVENYAYGDEGGHIDITLKDEGEEFTLLFADYGKGIPEVHLPKVFDAFFTTGGGKGGTGLGLDIVNRIVTTQLGGTIICDSKKGEGAIFTLTIPKNINE